MVTVAETRVLAAVGARAAEITRAGERTRQEVPIGTRDPDRLSLLVDGRRARLVPGVGKYSRKSYRVEAWVGEAHYLLKPEVDGSALCVDGAERAFFPGGDQPAIWLPDQATSRDAMIGYALVGAFGVGARSLYDAVMSVAVMPVVGGKPPG